MVAARCLEYHKAAAKKRQVLGGGDKKSENYKKSVPVNLPEPIESREIVAEEFGISPRNVEKANIVRLYGTEESVKAVENRLILLWQICHNRSRNNHGLMHSFYAAKLLI